MRAVNLLPQDERRKGLEEGARAPLLVAAGGIALVTIAATFVASLSSVSASGTRSDVESVEAAINALPKPPEQAVSQNTLVQERSQRVSALAQALSGRVAFDRLFRQISYVLPEDAWLTQLDATAPASSTDPAAAAGTPPGDAAAATDVTLQGGTWSHEQVAVVLARLAAVPSLTDVRLTGSTRVEPGQAEGDSAEPSATPDRPFVTFVVSAAIRTETKP
jgi:Tfp pilus assembly protein PilN